MISISYEKAEIIPKIRKKRRIVNPISKELIGVLSSLQVGEMYSFDVYGMKGKLYQPFRTAFRYLKPKKFQVKGDWRTMFVRRVE